MKDAFAATKTKKASFEVATYLAMYPFQPLLEFVEQCNHILKFFRNHHVVKAQLRELQITSGARTLARQAPTRWGTIQAMCATLLQSERHLHSIVSARDFVQGSYAQKCERKKVKDAVVQEEFVNNLNKVLSILGPIHRRIVKYQSDKVPIS